MRVASVLADPAYARLKQFVLDRTGLHYYAEKDEDLAARMARRMKARGVQDCSGYLRLLNDDDASGGEWDALVGEVTIGETYFFRQVEHFDLLRSTILPDLIERKKHIRRLRIWSAGCATGAEPYSISLVLKMDFAQQLRDWDVTILGTDINVDFLAQARTGRFAEWALRQIPDSLKPCCFRREGQSWYLLPEYRRDVRFEHHNLASSGPYPGSTDEPLDVIVCRNVMIYFSADRIRGVGEQFHQSLAPGGWLLVGHAEPSTANFPQFEVLTNAQGTAYRKPLDRHSAADPLAVDSTAVDLLKAPSWSAPDELEPSPFMKPVRAPGSKGREQRQRIVTPRSADPGRLNSAGKLEQARALADMGDWSAAESICRQLIQQDQLNAEAHFTLALALEHGSSHTDAQGSLRRAIYLDRGFTLAHYHLGLLLQADQDWKQARKSFQNVMDLLRSASDDEAVPHGDGIRAGELREIATMHLDLTRHS